MISVMSHGEKFVRLDSFFDIEKGTAEFRISTNYGGQYLVEKYTDFAKAAKAYRNYAKKIQEEKAAA